MQYGAVTYGACLERHEELLGKLDSIEKRLFRDNGCLSIQTRLDRHDNVIRALMWVVTVAGGTGIALAVTLCFTLLRRV